MPPKRASGTSPTQPPVKMIKVCTESQDLDCDPMEHLKFRLPETSRFSPFPNNESEDIEIDDETVASSGIRTDTISLLMKIEQLQAQLRYERRCRLLAERELRELKEMNALMMQMRHTAHELRVTLDQAMQGREPAVTPQNTHDESMSFLAEPEAEADMRMLQNVAEDDDNYLYLAENLRVPKNLYERVAEITDFRKYTSGLLMMLFDRETLATHSLQGRRANITGEDCQKPQLPPDIMRSIMDHVAVKFGVDGSQIKTAIRTKLNNEDKLMKRRLGLGKAENKACQDASFLPDHAEITNANHL